jgi:cell division protein FtsQ
MARKSGSTVSQEELYPLAEEPSRESDDALDDAKRLDLDVDQEAPFLRGQKRISVRRGALPKKTATRLLWVAVAATLVMCAGLAVARLYRYGEHSWRFRVDSSDDIDLKGLENVSRSQVMEVMGGDIGRNIFFIPLAQRQAQLEQIPWVESASVMRFVPNRLRIEIHERAPVAFARVGSQILLADATGALMELPGNKKKYSFPVILGINQGEPPSTRSARMKIFSDLVRQLDSGGARYSQDLSEADLSDPDDVKVVANHADGVVLVHLGSSNYLERYKIYVAHLQEWRQQFDKLESVDLRYDHQIIVNPELQGTAKQPPLSPVAFKKAMAAGVKPAALIAPIGPVQKPASDVTEAGAKPAAKKKSSGAHHNHKSVKAGKHHDTAPVAKSAAPAAHPATTGPAQGPTTTSKTSGPKPSAAVARQQEP